MPQDVSIPVHGHDFHLRMVPLDALQSILPELLLEHDCAQDCDPLLHENANTVRRSHGRGQKPSLANRLRDGVEASQKALLEIFVIVKFLDELCDVHERHRFRVESYAGRGTQKDLHVMFLAFYDESTGVF